MNHAKSDSANGIATATVMTRKKASEAELKPVKIEGTLAFMVETCWPYRPTPFALERAQPDYDLAWAGFPKAKLP